MIKNIQCRVEDNFIYFSWKPLKELNNHFIFPYKDSKIIQIRFIPKTNKYVMEVVYEIDIPDLDIKNDRIIGIDIGLNNLMTVTNNIGLKPFVVNGKPLKSTNQYYNKEASRLKSETKIKNKQDWSNRLQKLTDKRNNKIKDYIHKSSKYIIDYCINNKIDTIIIGKNKNWKQESSMSKKVNQNFVQIPFAVLIDQIVYKARTYGIQTILTEESYTSGTSFLDGEEPIKKNYNKSRRLTRGLFKSEKGVMINADVNGSYQIIKKAIPNAFDGIEGVGLHPVVVNL
jgi:putative transposase